MLQPRFSHHLLPLLVGSFLAVTAESAVGTTHYVSRSGSDTLNAGTKSAPWRTVSFACRKVTNKGDTIQIGPGLFAETEPCVLASGVNLCGSGKSGSSATTIQPVPHVVNGFNYMPQDSFIRLADGAADNTISNFAIDGNHWTNDIAIATERYPNAAWNDYSKDASAITIHNLRVSNFAVMGVWFEELSGGKIYNCDFIECSTGGNVALGELNLGGVRNSTVHDCTFTGVLPRSGFGLKLWDRPTQNTTIYNLSFNLQPIWTAGSEPNLAIEFAHSCAVKVNVYSIVANAALSIVLDANSTHNGKPYLGPGDAVHLSKTTLTAQPNVGYVVEMGGSDVQVDHCFFDGSKSSAFGNQGLFQIFANYGAGTTLDNVRIHHNVVRDVRYNLVGTAAALTHFKLYNNTILAASSSWQPGFNVLSVGTGSYSDIQIINNVFYQPVLRPSAAWVSGSPTAFSGKIDNNCVGNLPLPTLLAGATFSKNIFKDPQLSLSGALPFPYFSAAGTKSPIVNAGMVLPGYTDGYSGTAPDIGAYEFDPVSP